MRTVAWSMLLGLAGCGRCSFDGAELIVEPVYPQHSAWNSYVSNRDVGADINHQPDVDCEPDRPIGPAVCVHGGEKRHVAVPDESSCADLVATDALGAFEWVCDDTDGIVVFYSRGLARSAGLAELLDGTAFRSNHVTVTRHGAPIGHSVDAVWWDNPVADLPPGSPGALVAVSGSATDPGPIYVVTGTHAVAGVVLDGDRIALVVQRGGLLESDTSAALTCNDATGSLATPDARCLVIADGRRFLWIEGRFQGAPLSTTGLPQHVLSIASSRLAVVRRVETSRCQTDCIKLVATQNSRIEQVGQHSSMGVGIHLASSSFNRIVDARTANNLLDGVLLDGPFAPSTASEQSSHNLLANLVSYANGRDGIGLWYSTQNIVAGVVAAYSGRSGVYAIAGQHVLTHVTAVGNGFRGVWLDRKNGGHRLASVVTLGNGAEGFFDSDTSVSAPGIYDSIVSTDNAAFGITDSTVAETRIYGVLTVGSNTLGDCEQLSPPGSVIDVTCTTSGLDGSTDYTGSFSAAVLRPGRSAAASLAGRIETNDVINGSDALGVGGPVTDWLDFDSPFRVWGPDAANPTLARGRCLGTCRIWDLRPRSGDTVLVERTGDGVTPNMPFVVGTGCPPLVAGDRTLADLVRLEVPDDGVGNDDGLCTGNEVCLDPDVFLVHAIEILDDEIGDDDALCEAREACVYTPNFGAYQGEGDWRGRECVFDDGGEIRAVRMFGYPANGTP